MFCTFSGITKMVTGKAQAQPVLFSVQPSVKL